MRRALATLMFAGMLMAGLAGTASADPEWCDTGSPPANDFRLRPTGGGSVDSSTSWLKSTTSGTLDLANEINTLEGGVARGMRQAVANARSWESLPQRGYRAAD